VTIYHFRIGGKINAKSLDEAVDILKLLLEEQGITIQDISIFGLDGDVSEICRKK